MEMSFKKKLFYFFLFKYLIFSIVVESAVFEEFSLPKNLLANCDVFDPFKVLPENSRYQIGGAFALHKEDCLTLQAGSVNEIIGVQWALSYWNQKAKNFHSKLGFFAGDSCSRPKEAVSQTLRFLDSVGYHDPPECINPFKKPEQKLGTLIGIISPKDSNSANALAQILKISDGIPIASFSTASTEQLLKNNLKNIISTSPTLATYISAFIRLIHYLNKSDLITIVDEGENSPLTTRVIKLLKSNGIFVAEIIAFDHPLLSKILLESDAKIILSLVGNQRMKQIKLDSELLASRKVWTTLILEENDSADDFLDNVKPASNVHLQLINIRAHYKKYSEFGAYFQRVLQNNFNSFSLLRAYAEQVFNCSTTINTKNDISFDEVCKNFDKSIKNFQRHQPNTIEPILKMVYALAYAAKHIESNSTLKAICQTSTSIECHDYIIMELLQMNYKFEEDDPNELNDEIPLRFHRDTDGVILQSGLKIDVQFLERQGRDGVVIYKLIEMRTDWESNFNVFTLPTILKEFRSTCVPYRSNCNQCDYIKRKNDDEIFLSNPQTYTLYIAGLFDFHYGPNCEILLENVALPLAFVHSMWREGKKLAKKTLNRLNFGAILIDACSSSRNVMEFLVDSETTCYSFQQSQRNWTIVPASTIGYVMATSRHTLANDIVKSFFTNKNIPPPIVSVDNVDSNSMFFSTIPNYKNLALAITKYLRKMRWELINVVLEETDADSIAIFKQFEHYSKGICIAGIHGRKYLPSSSHVGPIPNVTVVFSTAKFAAEFLSGKLRGSNPLENMPNSIAQIHVMVGDAHDFHLYDPTNLEHYIGTVSIQPADELSQEFKKWLESVTPLSLPETWFWRHVEERWRCALTLANAPLYQGRLCTGEELLDVQGMGRMQQAGYLAKSISRLFKAISEAFVKLCAGDSNNKEDGICTKFLLDGRKQIKKQLVEMEKHEDKFEMLEFEPIDHHGNFGYKLLVNYSTASGFEFIRAYNSYTNGLEDSIYQPHSRCLAPLCQCNQDNFNSLLSPNFDDNIGAVSFSLDSVDQFVAHKPLRDAGSYVKKEPAGVTFEDFLTYDTDIEASLASSKNFILFDESQSYLLNYAFLTLSTLLSLVALATLALIILKMYLRSVKGSQSLGIILLIGIILLFVTSYAFITNPSEIICRTRIIAHALAHTICFGVMVVKAVQLRNAESLGGIFGSHHLSYLNYWLMLTFILVVQFVICIRWLADSSQLNHSSSHHNNNNNNNFKQFSESEGINLVNNNNNNIEWRHLRCSYSSNVNFVLAEAYAFMLVMLSLILSAFNRNIKRNYKEAKWLFAASLCCSVIIALWIFAQILVPSAYLDYLTILELYLNGALILAFLFGPKLYVLLSYEPIIVECNYGITNLNSTTTSSSSGSSLAGGSSGGGSNKKSNCQNEKQFDLFETDWSPAPAQMYNYNSLHVQSQLPHSPILSSSTRTSSPVYTNPHHNPSFHSSKNILGSFGGDSSPNMSSIDSGIHVPIFQTILRKKHGLRRAHSATEPHLIMGGAVVLQKQQQQQSISGSQKHCRSKF